MADGLLFQVVKKTSQHHIDVRRRNLQFTIESRELRPESAKSESRSTVIEAADRGSALSEFIRRSAFELMSFATPARGRESIATVKKNDSVYLVRVYEA